MELLTMGTLDQSTELKYSSKKVILLLKASGIFYNIHGVFAW